MTFDVTVRGDKMTVSSKPYGGTAYAEFDLTYG